MLHATGSPHWGVYSVPTFHGEWYPRRMYREDYEETVDYAYAFKITQ